MIKTLASAAAFSGLLFAAAPAFADCAADMKMTDAMMMKSTDAAKKDMAMKEMEMAKDMMAKKDETGCMMHTGEAMKDLK